jgi:mannosidase alpha-like ER degradation enhancer 2
MKLRLILNAKLFILFLWVFMVGAARHSSVQTRPGSRAEFVTTDVSPEKCRPEKATDGEMGRLCTGVGGYELFVGGSEDFLWITVVPPHGKAFPLPYWRANRVDFETRLDRVSWRLQGRDGHKIPIALVLDASVKERFSDSPALPYTTIAKLAPNSVCVVAKVKANSPPPMDAASLADTATTRPCVSQETLEQQYWQLPGYPPSFVTSVKSKPPPNRTLAAQVRSEFLHAWNAYKKYAWGHDDLRPLSKTFHDWYGQSLLMTPVDSLDTMIIMGLNQEAKSTREYIAANLSFDKDIYVQNFEVTIRLLGGLLSSYQLTGDKRLLVLAEDLGTRLLPAFDSPTGMPYRFVNLKTGKVRDPDSNPAETGTLLIEFGTLSKLTNKPIFYNKAKRALVETYTRRSPIGLVGEQINVETGEWKKTDSHISGAIDSYYEYLLKCWLLFGDSDCKRMWRESIDAVNKYLSCEMLIHVDTPIGRAAMPFLWYRHADMNTGEEGANTFGALDAFFPAVLALSGDLRRAKLLQDDSFRMWKFAGIEPEEFDFGMQKIISPAYHLRPEIVESAYYLYHYTRNPKYLKMGKQLFEDFVKYCKTDEAYASLKSVVTKEKSDVMHSFLFAETFKYFYLLFAPPSTLRFDSVIFNTEAHPIRRAWTMTSAVPMPQRKRARPSRAR